jgi:chemotaxis protein MotB
VVGEIEVVDMGAHANVAPVIIKRKKVIKSGGHHGGAWKVAYTDFVTAMMAFFMLMCLLNATTETQKKGLADYFWPTIPINRISGGGDGAFGGDSVFSENTLPQIGTGATSMRPTEQNQARGDTGTADEDGENVATQNEKFESLEAALVGRGGESMVMENALEHIVTRVTDEGLVIEVFATPDQPLFDPATQNPTDLLKTMVFMIADIAKTVTNGIAVEGHVPAAPIVLADNRVWDISTRQAAAVRILFEDIDTVESCILRITGHADREPVTRNIMAVRNNRIEIIMLRE